MPFEDYLPTPDYISSRDGSIGGPESGGRTRVGCQDQEIVLYEAPTTLISPTLF